jgi:hypothetical protein
MTSIGGSMPTYDANGNVLNDFLHTYAWDADGHPTTIDGVLVTYDALDRMVERNNTGTFSEIAYAPDSTKLEIMNGQSGGNAFAPLPGGAMAVWTAGGTIVYYRHPDHLGSARFASTSTRTMYYDGRLCLLRPTLRSNGQHRPILHRHEPGYRFESGRFSCA